MKIKNRAEIETEKDNKKNNINSQNQTRESRIYKALCYYINKSKLILSSSSVKSDKHSSFSDQQSTPLTSLTHYMVQEKLDQMITETQEVTKQEKIKQEKIKQEKMRRSKFIVMMAMEKCSYDPREDFRESMIEMIVVNKIKEVDELRSLLDCYVMMNPCEYRSLILEIFYEVCAVLFL